MHRRLAANEDSAPPQRMMPCEPRRKRATRTAPAGPEKGAGAFRSDRRRNALSPAPSQPSAPILFSERSELAPLAALLEQLVEQIAGRLVSVLLELEKDSRRAEASSPWMGIG